MLATLLPYAPTFVFLILVFLETIERTRGFARGGLAGFGIMAVLVVLTAGAVMMADLSMSLYGNTLWGLGLYVMFLLVIAGGLVGGDYPARKSTAKGTF